MARPMLTAPMSETRGALLALALDDLRRPRSPLGDALRDLAYLDATLARLATALQMGSTGHQNPHAAAYPAGSAAPHRQPAHSAYGCFRCNTVESAVRSFAFARFIAADITGAATAPNPDGSPRLRRIILVPSATAWHV
jgi:hypothetical protein